ncbi:ATP-binding cassette domain-containing protein [Synechococcus sp. CBW1004]|uniref:ATP-binding cassette domain-containing protein n=1 Tax=Synechococcus sp. CBW1004 TaxID=1353136 RepID=UPI001E34C930|nr:ATP-binding cassette domain-containing protein [Synechococcus sp. CBW1004]
MRKSIQLGNGAPQSGTILSGKPDSGQLLRDLTLSPAAPMAFCVRLLLQQLQWTGRSEQLFELFDADPRRMDLVDARNLLLRLGFHSTKQVLNHWGQLNPQLLPALYLAPDNVPWVLSRDKGSAVVAGNVNGRSDVLQLEPGGVLILIQERSGKTRIGMLQEVFYRFTNRIGLLYVISFGLALLALTLPFYIRAIYNLAIPSDSIASTSWIFLGVLVLFDLTWILRQWRSTVLAQLGGRIDALLGVALVEKTFSLDLRQIEAMGRFGLQSRQRNLDSLLSYLQGPMALACLDFPYVVIYLLAIALISGWLVLVPLVLMLVSGLMVWTLSRFYAGAAEMNLNTGIGLAQAQQELVHRFLDVKLTNVEWVWLQRLRGLSAQSATSSLTLNQQVGQLQVITSTSSQLAAVLTLAIGAWMAYGSGQGSMAMGNLIASMFFVWRVFGPFQQLMNALLRFSTMRAQYSQLDQFLNLRNSPRITTTVQHREVIRLRGAVLLDSAACRVSNDNSLAITRASLTVSPGQILAVTGNPGCGKSTVLRVIDQLLPMVSGSLLLDGKDYRQFTTDTIQRNIAFLMDKVELLPGTIWSYLTTMNPEACAAEVRELCDQLQLLPIIESLPQGFDTELNDAVTYQLPSGVLKLLALAQAVIKDAPILLLDDISLGLSPDEFESVLALLPSLRRCLFSGQERSVILATDNKLLLEQADLLCILDKGVTVFQGTPDELRRRMQRSATADC